MINCMPVVIELTMTCCGNLDTRFRLIREIISIINKQDETAGYEPLLKDRKAVRKVFDDVLSGIGDFNAEPGSIRIYVHPLDISNFFRLLNACVKGVLTAKLKPLQDIIRTEPGCEHYEHEAILYRDHYTCIMENLVSQLAEHAQAKGLTIPRRKPSKPMISENGKLILKVECLTEDDRSQFERCVQNGQLRKVFKPLDTLLHGADKNVALDVMIHSEEEGPKYIVARDVGNSDMLKAPKKIKDINVKMSTDSAQPSITGFAVVPPNYVIGADFTNNCIKLFDFEQATGRPILMCNKSTCKPGCRSCKPWDVVMIDEHDKQAVVSVPDIGKLIFVKIKENQLFQYKELIGHDHCRGLTFANNRLYVGYEHPKCQVKVIGINGEEIRVIDNGKFHSPWYMAFDNQSKSLYISEVMQSRVYQLDEDGNIVKIIKTNDIINTQRGIDLKDSSTLFLVGHGQKQYDFVYEVDVNSGKSHVILYSEIERPNCVQRFKDSLLLSEYNSSRIMQFKIV